MKIVENEFIKYMEKYDKYPFKIILENKEHIIGLGEPNFTIKINKTPTISDLLTSTSLTLGEAYMNGEIEILGDLFSVLNLFLSQMDKFSTDTKKLKKLIFTSMSKSNQKKEVSSHYDIGNDFYKLWLDETLSYSCGYFKNENDSLYNAQINKVERILEKLYLSENMTLCDIGCGWGFLLIEACKKYNIKGVGITLSKEQKEKFEEKIKEENLSDRLKVILLDYRDLYKLNLKFDRVVSVGMIEHVGRGNYEEFLKCVKSILKPNGVFLLHFISALKEYPGDPWIKKYIFPGGVIPSLREIINIAGDLDFFTIDVESLRRHYTKTLLCWSENFKSKRNEVVKIFDEKFAKSWELYLISCAAAFNNGVVDLHQILFTNNVNNSLPILRWY
ncbi:MAG: class I SAM-dependent methyltransferase [Lachnospirales bacterium]